MSRLTFEICGEVELIGIFSFSFIAPTTLAQILQIHKAAWLVTCKSEIFFISFVGSKTAHVRVVWQAALNTEV